MHQYDERVYQQFRDAYFEGDDAARLACIDYCEEFQPLYVEFPRDCWPAWR